MHQQSARAAVRILHESEALPCTQPASRAGQFLTEFGRQNQTHPHAWDFVDQRWSWAVSRDDGFVARRAAFLAYTRPFYSNCI